MKVGDLVTLCKKNYPQYAGQFGMLVGQDIPDWDGPDSYRPASMPTRCWVIMINGRLHPFYIDIADIERVCGSLGKKSVT
jgi:hypothetical protein